MNKQPIIIIFIIVFLTLLNAQEYRSLKHESAVKLVTYSLDGKLLASYSDNHTVTIWTTDDYHILKTIESSSDEILQMWFTQAGELKTFSNEGVIDRWNPYSVKKIGSTNLHLEENPYSAVVSPTHSRLYLTFWGEVFPPIKIWDLQKNREIKTGWYFRDIVSNVALSKDGSKIAFTDDSLGHGEDATTLLHVYDTKNFKHIATKNLLENSYESGKLAFLPNEDKVVYYNSEYDEDGNLKNNNGLVVWDYKHNKEEIYEGLGSDDKTVRILNDVLVDSVIFEKENLTIPPIYFQYNSSKLNGLMKQQLKKYIYFIKKKLNHSQQIRLVGNTDQTGTGEFKFNIGFEYARRVKDYLVSLGIKSEKISITSAGKNNPVCLENRQECYNENRRVDIYFLP